MLFPGEAQPYLNSRRAWKKAGSQPASPLPRSLLPRAYALVEPAASHKSWSRVPQTRWVSCGRPPAALRGTGLAPRRPCLCTSGSRKLHGHLLYLGSQTLPHPSGVAKAPLYFCNLPVTGGFYMLLLCCYRQLWSVQRNRDNMNKTQLLSKTLLKFV